MGEYQTDPMDGPHGRELTPWTLKYGKEPQKKWPLLVDQLGKGRFLLSVFWSLKTRLDSDNPGLDCLPMAFLFHLNYLRILANETPDAASLRNYIPRDKA